MRSRTTGEWISMCARDRLVATAQRIRRAIGRRLLSLQPELARRVSVLEWRLSELEKGLDFAITDDWCRWLYLNRAERMDATVGYFNPGRRRFHLDRYLFASQHVANKKVADIATGTGYGAEVLRIHGGAAEVIGLDIDPKAIEYALERHRAADVRFACRPAEDTGLDDESLDAVVSFETLEHLQDAHAAIREFSRILKPHGRLICSVPNRWPIHLATHHVREYDDLSFTALLTARFRIDALYNQNSGMTDAPFNRGQPSGFVLTTTENAASAECYLALCSKPSGPTADGVFESSRP